MVNIKRLETNTKIETILILNSRKTRSIFNAPTRKFSTSSSGSLTHVDEEGIADMVDVSRKSITCRIAIARGSIFVGADIMRLIKENNIKKGDVLSISKLAGIMAAKKTCDLIPLCHNIPLNSIKLSTSLDDQTNYVHIEASIKCDGKTGVEMEALTAVTVSALTVYDMCKSVSKNMRIDNIHLVSKEGGSSGNYDSSIHVRRYEDMEMHEKCVFLEGI